MPADVRGILFRQPVSEPRGDALYLRLSTATLRAVGWVTQAAIDRLSQFKPGDPVLPWVDVPHVLYRGSIPFDWFTRPDEDVHQPHSV